MFGRCLVGIGFVLLLDAVVTVVGIAGFAKSGAIEELFQSHGGSNSMTMNSSPGSQQLLSTSNFNALPVASNANSPDLKIADLISRKQTPSERPFLLWNRSQERAQRRNPIVVCHGLYDHGSFFFAKTLWGKMQHEPIVVFDEHIFWAGLWFRLGSAIVFTVVIYLALLYKGYSDSLSIMPFLGLIVGLSVKGTEHLIDGITTRILNAIKGLVSR